MLWDFFIVSQFLLQFTDPLSPACPMMPDSSSLEIARDGMELVEVGQATRLPLEGGQDGESSSARLLLNSWLADPVETGGWVQELRREQDGEGVSVLDASSEDSEEEGATEEPIISVKKEVVIDIVAKAGNEGCGEERAAEEPLVCIMKKLERVNNRLLSS